jgi:hypothetical protein
MAMFNSYVKLPEGKCPNCALQIRIYLVIELVGKKKTSMADLSYPAKD